MLYNIVHQHVFHVLLHKQHTTTCHIFAYYIPKNYLCNQLTVFKYKNHEYNRRSTKTNQDQ